MTLKEWIQREKYVAIHAQTWRFRVVKYCVLLLLFSATWYWKGGVAVGILFAVLFVLALTVHFFFRWKSKAWTQSWGPYKKLDLPK